MEGNGKSSGRRGEGRRKENELGKRGTRERRMTGKRKEEGFQSSCLERKEIGSGRVIVLILHCVLYHVHFILYNSLPSYPLLLLSSKRNKPLLFSIDSSPSHNSLTFISIPITSSKQALNTIIPFNCISPILSHPRGLRTHRQMTSSFTSYSCFVLSNEAASSQTVLVRSYNYLHGHVCHGDRGECAKCRLRCYEILLQRFL